MSPGLGVLKLLDDAILLTITQVVHMYVSLIYEVTRIKRHSTSGFLSFMNSITRPYQWAEGILSGVFCKVYQIFFLYFSSLKAKVLASRGYHVALLEGDGI